MFKNRRKTPVTAAGLRKYDHLPPAEAARRAWSQSGNHPEWDRQRKEDMRDMLPLLARALDRLERDGIHAGNGRHSAVRPSIAGAKFYSGTGWMLDEHGHRPDDRT